MKAVLFLAVKDAFKDKKIFGLVVMILAASYINLIFFTSILNGFVNTFQDQLIDLITSHVTLEPKEGQKFIDGVNNIEKKLDLVPGVVSVAPRLDSGGTISFKTKTISASIIGVTPSKESLVTIISQKITSGEFLGDSDTDQIVLGNSMIDSSGNDMTMGASMLGSVSVGDRVTVSYGNGVMKTYRVKGIVNTNFGMSDRAAYITNKELESVFGIKDVATTILVKTTDKSASEKFKLLMMEQNIAAIPKAWQENAGFIEQIRTSFSMVISATTLVSLLTAAMTIGIIIYINTIHKRRVIGILKAIGTRNGAVLRMFLIESVIFGVCGIVIGVVFGNIMIAYFNTNPLDLPFGLVRPELKNGQALNAAISLLVTVLVAGLYPAYAAARSNIVKSIFGG